MFFPSVIVPCCLPGHAGNALGTSLWQAHPTTHRDQNRQEVFTGACCMHQQNKRPCIDISQDNRLVHYAGRANKSLGHGDD